MNRRERRAFDRSVRNDKKAVVCPACMHKSKYYKQPSEGSESGYYDIVCARCEKVVVKRAGYDSRPKIAIKNVR